jgi:hypothetical protein
MGLDIWFKDDIKNILLGVELANARLATHYSNAEVRAYRQGFQAALAAAAVSFGICPPGIVEVDSLDAQPSTALFPSSPR